MALRRGSFASVIAVALFLSTVAGAAARSHPESSVSFTRLVRSTDTFGVFTVAADSSGLTQTLKGTSKETGTVDYADPAWSNDGRQLAVAIVNTPNEGTGNGDVWVMRPGQPLIKMPGGRWSDWSDSPSWAPDGQRIVLVGRQAPPGGGLYIAKVGSKRSTALTPEHQGMGGQPLDDTPAWSRDGSMIAFVRTTFVEDMAGQEQPDTSNLYVIRPDGSGLRKLAPGFNPSWSPDSKRIVFDDGNGRIAIINVTGRHLAYISKPADNDADPAWSPDGRTIAFVRFRPNSNTGDIWLMNANGTAPRLLVRNGDTPTWKRG